MNIRSIFSLLLTFVTIAVNAQMVEPVKWSFKIDMTDDTHGAVVMRASIEEGCHMYSNDVDPDVGPTPLTITFDKLEGAKLIGTPAANKATHEEYDDMFEANLSWWTNSVVLRQQFEATAPEFSIEGSLRFSACNDMNCIPPTTETIELTGTAKIAAETKATATTAAADTKKEVPVEVAATVPAEEPVAVVEPVAEATVEEAVETIAPVGPLATEEEALAEADVTGKREPSTARGIIGLVLFLGLAFGAWRLFNDKKMDVMLANALGMAAVILAVGALSWAQESFGLAYIGREVVLSVWIALFGLLGMYLLGMLKIGPRHTDGGTGRTSVLRCFIALVSLAFMVYLIPGLWGAPLDVVKDIIPSIDTQDFLLHPTI